MSRKSRKPLIGITTYGRLAALPFSLPSEYIDAVRASGGIPTENATLLNANIDAIVAQHLTPNFHEQLPTSTS